MLHCPVKYDDTTTNSSLVARNNLLYRFARLIFGPWEQIDPTYLLAKSMREKLIVLLRARKWAPFYSDSSLYTNIGDMMHIRSTTTNDLEDVYHLFALLLQALHCIGFLDRQGWGEPDSRLVLEAVFYIIATLIHLIRSLHTTELDEAVPVISRQPSVLVRVLTDWSGQLSRSIIWFLRTQGGLLSIELSKLGLAIASLFLGYVYFQPLNHSSNNIPSFYSSLRIGQISKRGDFQAIFTRLRGITLLSTFYTASSSAKDS